MFDGIKWGSFYQHKKDGYVIRIDGSVSGSLVATLDIETEFGRQALISHRDLKRDFKLLKNEKQAIMANTLYGRNPIQKGK